MWCRWVQKLFVLINTWQRLSLEAIWSKKVVMVHTCFSSSNPIAISIFSKMLIYRYSINKSEKHQNKPFQSWEKLRIFAKHLLISLPSLWRQSQWLHVKCNLRAKATLLLIMTPLLWPRRWWQAIFAIFVPTGRHFFSVFPNPLFFLHLASLGARFLFQLWCNAGVNEPGSRGGKAARWECSCPRSVQTWENSNCSDIHQFAKEGKKCKRETKLASTHHSGLQPTFTTTNMRTLNLRYLL